MEGIFYGLFWLILCIDAGFFELLGWVTKGKNSVKSNNKNKVLSKKNFINSLCSCLDISLDIHHPKLEWKTFKTFKTRYGISF